MGKRMMVAVLLLAISAASVWALMPPQVYKDRIIKSPIKATAEVESVKVIKTTDNWVQKLVWFKVIQSYGSTKVEKKFAAYCFSAGRVSMVGGRIYFYPTPGDKVYVTAQGENMEITSYTPLTTKLQAALDQGLETLKIGIGSVSAE